VWQKCDQAPASFLVLTEPLLDPVSLPFVSVQISPRAENHKDVSKTGKMASTTASNSDHNNDLPYFLTVLQHFDVDILPITWQPSLDSLGRGRFTMINQSLVNVQMSLAFKRCRSSTMYKDLIAEIAILSDPTVRQHPNLSPLVGVCWEITTEFGGATPDIMPVLVFPKASHGSLQTYLSGNSKGKLSTSEIRKICHEIANATDLLHNSGLYSRWLRRDAQLNVMRNRSRGFEARQHSSVWQLAQ
jgi:serine/threonine protein kinase